MAAKDYESYLVARDGSRRLIAWSSTVLPGERRHARLHHRDRHRHHRAQAPGESDSGNQRAKSSGASGRTCMMVWANI